MTLITLFFFAHQPDRLLPYERRRHTAKVAPEKLHSHYFDDELNRLVFHKVAEKCYYPATKMILELVEGFKEHDKPFRFRHFIASLWRIFHHYFLTCP